MKTLFTTVLSSLLLTTLAGAVFAQQPILSGTQKINVPPCSTITVKTTNQWGSGEFTVTDDDCDGIICLSIVWKTSYTILIGPFLDEFGNWTYDEIKYQGIIGGGAMMGNQFEVASITGAVSTVTKHTIDPASEFAVEIPVGQILNVVEGEVDGFDGVIILDASSLSIGSSMQDGVLASLPKYNGTVLVGLRGTLIMTESGLANFGEGTPGCAGTHAMDALSRPTIGNNNFTMLSDKAAANTLGVLLIGSSGQDGVDVFGIGANLHINLFASMELFTFDILSDASGVGAVSAAIPNVPALAGASYFAQTLWFNPAPSCPLQSIYNLSSTPGLQITILAK